MPAGGDGAIRTGVVTADRQATELYNAVIRAPGIEDLSMAGGRGMGIVVGERAGYIRFLASVVPLGT